MARDEQESFLAREVLHDRLGEALARRGEQHTCGGAFVLGFGALHRVPEWLAHHHHAGPAAEWAVVNLVVLVVGEPPDIGDEPVDDPRGSGPASDALAQDRLEESRKKGEDVDPHRH